MTIQWELTLQINGDELVAVADYVAADTYQELTRGSTQSFTVSFSSKPASVRGGTAGGPEGFTVGGGSGATAGTVTYKSQYEAVRSLLTWPDAAVHGLNTSAIPWYREDLPPRADVDSLVIQIQPVDEIGRIQGIWGLVVGGADETQFIGQRGTITLEMIVLAEASEYETHADLQAALSAPII